MSDHPRRLRTADAQDRLWRVWQALPEPWRGPVIGPDVPGWSAICETGQRRIDLTGLPDPFGAEMAWMAHWQTSDGTQPGVFAYNHLANMLRWAIRQDHPLPASIRAMDWADASALQGWFYATRWKRLPSTNTRSRLRIVFRFARLALLAHCHDGRWWTLDDWYPRCDPRIPLTAREPVANYGCRPGNIVQPWLREAAKWCLGTMLEAGTLRWTTVSQERMKCLRRFDKWLTDCFDDPLEVLGDPAAAAGQAAAFAHWSADPANRLTRAEDRRHYDRPVKPRMINDDLRAVAELFAFITANRAEAMRLLGTAGWEQLTDAHTASWFRQISRIPHTALLDDRHYVDDHALGQINAALPLLGLPRDQQMTVTRADGQTLRVNGFDDPQAMRMILLQMLTGRRASEIRTCEFDCLSAVPERTVDAEGGDIARFTYAQSKIDIAPDSILVDREIAAVIEEQQAWVRESFPGLTPRFLFVQRTGNRCGDKPYPPGTYNWMLREFTDLIRVTDSKGRPVRLSHTHRFRHTRLTRLAELGLPVHVLQRYAGHATPTMSMHYVAQRDEHAEQAFLATTKLKADGTRVTFSREDHDSLHLLDRADRFLPNGWCLLPPLQRCDKGNACLTCSMFVTDQTHRDTLTRQLSQTSELIDRATTAFTQRHGHPMPEDNVWLTQRRAEHAALTRLLASMSEHPGRALQGGGCGSRPSAPAPVTLDIDRHRRNQP